MGEYLVHHGMIVAAVVAAAARNQIWKLVLADEIATAHLDAFKACSRGNFVDRGFDRVVGWSLAKTAHRFLYRLVSRHRLRAVLYALDFVRPNDGADRLAQLKRRASRICARIVQRLHFHRSDDPVIVE